MRSAGETIDGHVLKEFKNYLSNAGKKYKTLWGKDVRGADSRQPLFANLSFHLPHTPVLPPKQYRKIIPVEIIAYGRGAAAVCC